MKKLLLVLAIQACIVSPLLAQGKSTDIKTETIKVEGVCSSCKKRIEGAAYIPGVKNAEWDKTSGLLTVSYKANKTSKNDIAKAVAAKGHHADDVKADRATYEKLPPCCAYESNHKH